jgi:TPR repeat protein
MYLERLGGLALSVVLLAAPALALPRDAGLAELEAAAAKGDAGAALRLGERYEHAEGVSRDYGRALRLYCEAARDGEAQAAYNIGWMHLNGRGVDRDEDMAGAWLARAASAGHEHAETLLRHFPAGAADPDGACPRKPAPETQDALVASPVPPKQIARLVDKMAPKFGLDPALVIAVIAVESAFRTDAVSPKNARGLMQLIPSTAERFGVRNAFDMTENLRGGMRYLRWLIESFEGDLTLALAAYNAGEAAVARYGGVPPYPETEAYVRKLRSLYPRSRHPF